MAKLNDEEDDDQTNYSAPSNQNQDFNGVIKVKRIGGNYELIGFFMILAGAGLGVFLLSSTIFFVISGLGLMTFLYGRFY